MVGVVAAEVVDVQGHHAVVDEAVEEFFKQVDIEAADEGADEIDVVHEAGSAGKVEDDAAQCFVERDVGVAVAADAGFVAQRLFQRLAEGDADVFDGVVVVNVGVTFAGDVEIDHAVAGDLIEHVFEEGHACIEVAFAGAVEVQGKGDLGFVGVAGDGDDAVAFAGGKGCGLYSLFGRSCLNGFLRSRIFRFLLGMASVHPAFGFAHAFFQLGGEHVGDAASVFAFFGQTGAQLVQRGGFGIACGAGEFGHAARFFDEAQEVFGADVFFIHGLTFQIKKVFAKRWKPDGSARANRR